MICFSEIAYKKACAERKGLFLLVFSKVEGITEDSNHIYIPIEPVNDKKCTELFTDSVMALNGDKSFINNAYYYGVATIEGVCSSIKGILERYSVKTVEIYGGTTGKYIPVYFTGWGESSKNILTSPNCFYEYVAESLESKYEVVRVKVDGSFLSHAKRLIRIFLVPLICFFLSLRKLSIKRRGIKSSSLVLNYFIVRTQHQYSVAKNVISSLNLDPNSVVLVEIEGLASSRLTTKLQESDYQIFSPYSGLNGLLLAFTSLLRSYYELFKVSRIKSEFVYNGVSYQLRNILIDGAIQPQVYIYEKLVSLLALKISERGGGRVFSFEQVSPQAYFDHKELDGVSSLSFIKSTLIQEIHMPCISWGRHFLVNDSSELSLQNYSVLNNQSITYSGSPKYTAILDLKKDTQKHMKQVLFATQPHEPEVNRSIVQALIEQGKKQSFEVVVRKHPRDREAYQFDAGLGVVFDSNSSLYQQLADSDLVISRTSTILEECIYIGVPYLSCLFSEKDRSYIAEYLSPTSGLVLNNLDKLLIELEDYDSLVRKYRKWREDYLIGFKPFTLNFEE